MRPHDCFYLQFTSYYNCIETITYYTKLRTRVLTIKIPDTSWPCDWCPSTCRILQNHTNKTCCWQIQVLYCLMYYFVFRKIDFRLLIVFKLPTNLPTYVTLDFIGHYFCFYPSRASFDDAHDMRTSYYVNHYDGRRRHRRNFYYAGTCLLLKFTRKILSK